MKAKKEHLQTHNTLALFCESHIESASIRGTYSPALISLEKKKWGEDDEIWQRTRIKQQADHMEKMC